MNILDRIEAIVGSEYVLHDEPMHKHTTFRTGGAAKLAVMPQNAEQIAELVGILEKEGIPYVPVGNGSNLLVSDRGYDGVVILLGKLLGNININAKECIIRAESGVLLSVVGAKALEKNLAGFEFAAGIPGTVGGGCVMNAGAYGGELKDVLESVKAVDRTGSMVEFPVSCLKMGYRHSIFLNREYIITEAVFKLHPGNHDEIAGRMADFSAQRRAKQPLEYPSAGSTFKRPDGFFAGQLIEEAGLKGKGFGDACVSEKHAGFVINKGNATSQDIYDTIRMAADAVYERSGIRLEPEVKFLGDFGKL